MIQSQFSPTRQAMRQTGSLVPLSPIHFPVNLGRSWTFRSVTQQWTGAAIVDETVCIERERIDGVTPLATAVDGAEWGVSVSHDVTLNDRSHEHFTMQLLLSETTVREHGAVPFMTTQPAWDGVSADGRTTYRYTSSTGAVADVLAGVFTDCLLVTEEARQNGDVLYRRQDWYAVGIGRVRSQFTQDSPLGRFIETRELTCFTAE